MTSGLRTALLALTGAAVLAGPFATPANAQTKLKLVLNWKYQGPQGLFFLAEDRGYYKAEGIDLTIDQGSGSGAAVPLVANGTYDVGFGDINALIELAGKKPEDAPIAVYVMFNQPPFTVAVKAESPIKAPKDSRAAPSAAPPMTARSSCSRHCASSPRSIAARSRSPTCSPICASRC
jgi:NitT/TauT family transport system substrate-binding protein